ncbi:MAG: exodeoxyribonuclease VII small subunit [Kiritimatiellia bacterium]
MSEKKKMSFEESLKRLDKIVENMESGEMELDAMISAFEEGRKLVESCTNKLNEVEQKIEKVVKDGPDGREIVPFDHEADV